jgi:hypothetical protein
MKNLILCLVLVFSFGLINAQNVSREEALQVGENYFKNSAAQFGITKDVFVVESENFLQTDNGNPAIYVFNFKDGGFVLVSADKRTMPVFAYSTESSFDLQDIAPATQLWIDKYMEQTDLIINQNIVADEKVKKAWSQYMSGNIQRGSEKSVSTLVTTRWNQNYPYNMDCPPHPAGPGGRVYAGCVATAMAQIMKYWNYPETGRGSKDYFWGDYFTVDYGATTYQWDSMSNYINTLSRNSIAELIFHCAISVDMNFSHTGSGSSITNSFFAMKQYFRYRAGVYELDKSDVEDFEWKLLLKEDLDKAHPILYRGTDDYGNGHAFVCDGYQDTSYFHFNWGWGGAADGYFYLDNINPQMDFHWGQGALLNITPNYAEYCNSMVYDQPQWTFNDGSGPNLYFNDTDCEWLIDVTGHEFDYMKIYFSRYDLLEGDVLTLYKGITTDAPVLGTYSASNQPAEIITEEKQILVKFVTNSDAQADGWELVYETVTLGVNDENNGNVIIYPNPVSDLLTISGLSTASNISIIDMSGRIVMEVNDFENSTLDISNLQSGMYFIKIEGDGNQMHKILKQ